LVQRRRATQTEREKGGRIQEGLSGAEGVYESSDKEKRKSSFVEVINQYAYQKGYEGKWGGGATITGLSKSVRSESLTRALDHIEKEKITGKGFCCASSARLDATEGGAIQHLRNRKKKRS